MTTTLTATCNQTTKVKRPREGGLCVTFSFWVLFCGRCFFTFYVFIKPVKFFFITKKLVITYKLNTIKGFYHKVTNFAMVLVFLFFCHNFKEMAKEFFKNIYYECVVNVNVWIHNGYLLTNHMCFKAFFWAKDWIKGVFFIIKTRCYFGWVVQKIKN